MTFQEAVLDAEEEILGDACRALGLDDDEVLSVLARHRENPGPVELLLILGGDAGDFIRARLEIRRAVRAPG